MRGYPISRVTSADGRYAFTLYDGGGSTPFVHVLDTVAGGAHCVDLPQLGGNNAIYSFRLRLEPDRDVAVALNGKPWLVVERASFRVSSPDKATSTEKNGFAWAPIGAGAAGIVALLAVSFILVRRRRHPAAA